MERPAFTPLAGGQEYCVVVTWPNGSKSRISAPREMRKDGSSANPKTGFDCDWRAERAFEQTKRLPACRWAANRTIC
jgi:hypothetical protein